MKRSAPALAPAVWEGEIRQFNRMIALGFLLLLVPATIGRLSGWRWWRPETPGVDGKRTILREAWSAAEEAVALTFPACYACDSAPRRTAAPAREVGLGANPKAIQPRGVSR